ncbi:cobyrinate a,c-diamide synthase [Geoglobus acetivorans]|uniref:Cobyrinic acid A,C-diamide synthase n=1 Tax=Geoglobus acetivorans TaxID=565033 RepID=A0A0A7GGA9_GEOAI|nr:Cobyrinic acid A,C-diamide synthase [Geoglobus acetivorans]
MHAFVIAGTNSGSGKTSIGISITSALMKRGLKVQPFKVGPDFIDPTHYSFCEWGVNLDAFMMGEDGVRRSFCRWTRGKDVALIEGVMGLYDGYNLTTFSSTAHIARILNIPVILTMNVRAMSVSALAMFEGFRNYDRRLNVAGVIFNSATKFHERLKRVFEEKGYRVFGVVPETDLLKVESRHLGLHLGMEVERDLDRIAEFAEEHIDIDGILEISELEIDCKEFKETERGGFKIGVPFDEAFSFYYRDNLEALRKFGKIEFFSPLKGERIECDAYYIGGGYPELYEFPEFLRFIRKEALDEKPIYAECGGMMVLSRTLEIDGKKRKMAGVLDLDIEFTKKLQALGYIRGEVIRDNPYFTGSFRGHEFHYSVAHPDSDVKFAFRTDGKGIACGLDGAMAHRTLAGYSHIHFHSANIKEFLRGNA